MSTKNMLDDLEGERARTFQRRKDRLFRKAMQLSVQCDCEIAVVIFNSQNKLYQYASGDIDDLLCRYSKACAEPHNNADLARCQPFVKNEPTNAPNLYPGHSLHPGLALGPAAGQMIAEDGSDESDTDDEDRMVREQAPSKGLGYASSVTDGLLQALQHARADFRPLDLDSLSVANKGILTPSCESVYQRIIQEFDFMSSFFRGVPSEGSGNAPVQPSGKHIANPDEGSNGLNGDLAATRKSSKKDLSILIPENRAKQIFIGGKNSVNQDLADPSGDSRPPAGTQTAPAGVVAGTVLPSPTELGQSFGDLVPGATPGTGDALALARGELATPESDVAIAAAGGLATPFGIASLEWPGIGFFLSPS